MALRLPFFLSCALIVLAVNSQASRAVEPRFAGGPSAAPIDLEERVAQLEEELTRTTAELRRQQSRLDHQDSRLERLPATDEEGQSAAFVSVRDSTSLRDTAAGEAPGDGRAKISEGVDVGSDLSFKARWNNGLLFETPAKDFTMHVGGRFHYDWVWFDPSASLEAPPAAGGLGPFQDGAFIRRARFQMDGKMWEIVDWNVELDFAGLDQASTQDTFNRAAASKETVLQDCWLQASELPVVGHLRAGHLKQPIGLENYNSSKFLTFMERGALHDAFLQEYDPGFLLWDNAYNDQLWWGTGFYRIDAEETGHDYGDGEYAWTSRLAFLAWDNPEHRYLLHLGGAYSLRSAEFDPATGKDVVRFRARPELRGTPRFVDTGTLEAEDVDLLGAELAWVQGSLSVQGEYMLSHVDNAAIAATGVPVGDADLQGYYVFVSYFLTGEHRPYDTSVAAFGRVKPHENFWLVRTQDGACLGRGAWELVARYSSVDLNDAGINGGILDQTTLGVNWYWNPNVRWMFNYIWSERDIAAPQQSGELHTLAMRIALDF